MDRKREFLEALLGVLIVLAVLMVFVEEGALAAGASWPLRRALALVSALLDGIFTVELAIFFARAFSEGRLRTWFFKEYGWLEAVATLPLIILVSGPFVFSLSTGIFPAAPLSGNLGGARLLRSLRVLRSLRLLRLVRFATPGVTGSKSAAANISRAAFLALTAAVVAPLIFDTAAVFGLAPDSRAAFTERRRTTLAALESRRGVDGAEAAALVDPDLLLVRDGGTVVYTRHSAAGFKSLYDPDTIGLLEGESSLEAYYDLSAENRALAVSSLSSACTALAVLLFVLIGYGRFFAAGVVRPISTSIAVIRGDRRGILFPPPGRESEEPFILAREIEKLSESRRTEDPIAEPDCPHDFPKPRISDTDTSPTCREEFEALLRNDSGAGDDR